MVVRQTGWCVMFHSPNGVALPAFRHAKPILGNEIVRVRASPTLALSVRIDIVATAPGLQCRLCGFRRLHRDRFGVIWSSRTGN